MTKIILKRKMTLHHYYFYRHLARPLILLFAKTPITANQITFLSMIFGIFAGCAIAFGSAPWRIAGFFLYQFAVLLDYCDGDIARIKNISSEFGEWWDNVSERIVEFFFFGAVAINAYYLSNDTLYLYLGMLMVFNATMISSLSQIKENLAFASKKSFTSIMKQVKSKNQVVRLHVGKSVITVIIMPLLVLFGYTTQACIFYSIVGTMMWLYQIFGHVKIWNSRSKGETV